MATKTSTKSRRSELLYAVVGVGDFAIEKARNVPNMVTSKTRTKLYKDFVKRGRTLTRQIGTAAPTRQAVDQYKTARSRVKAAGTSVAKAIRANAEGSSRRAADQTKVARTQVKAAATSVRKAAGASTKAGKVAASKAVQAS